MPQTTLKTIKDLTSLMSLCDINDMSNGRKFYDLVPFLENILSRFFISVDFYRLRKKTLRKAIYSLGNALINYYSL